MIELKNIQLFYDETPILNIPELFFTKGSFTSVLGPSGCGKSSLLRLIARLVPQTMGKLSIPEPTNYSFVFQEPQLLNWLTVIENIQLPFVLKKQTINPTKIQQLLSWVKLSESQNLFPYQLSGGMKMRVSLARALALDPEILLLDEPFSALDEIIRQDLQQLLHELWLEKKITVIFVTHSISEALFLSERILLLSPLKSLQESQIVQDKNLSNTLWAKNPRDFSLRKNAAFLQESDFWYQALKKFQPELR